MTGKTAPPTRPGQWRVGNSAPDNAYSALKIRVVSGNISEMEAEPARAHRAHRGMRASCRSRARDAPASAYIAVWCAYILNVALRRDGEAFMSRFTARMTVMEGRRPEGTPMTWLVVRLRAVRRRVLRGRGARRGVQHGVAPSRASAAQRRLQAKGQWLAHIEGWHVAVPDSRSWGQATQPATPTASEGSKPRSDGDGGGGATTAPRARRGRGQARPWPEFQVQQRRATRRRSGHRGHRV